MVNAKSGSCKLQQNLQIKYHFKNSSNITKQSHGSSVHLKPLLHIEGEILLIQTELALERNFCEPLFISKKKRYAIVTNVV